MSLFTLWNRQDRLQRGYIELAKSLPWIHEKLASLDLEESEEMLKKVTNFQH
jgi:ATP-dependent Lon protease